MEESFRFAAALFSRNPPLKVEKTTPSGCGYIRPPSLPGTPPTGNLLRRLRSTRRRRVPHSILLFLCNQVLTNAFRKSFFPPRSAPGSPREIDKNCVFGTSVFPPPFDSLKVFTQVFACRETTISAA